MSLLRRSEMRRSNFYYHYAWYRSLLYRFVLILCAFLTCWIIWTMFTMTVQGAFLYCRKLLERCQNWFRKAISVHLSIMVLLLPPSTFRRHWQDYYWNLTICYGNINLEFIPAENYLHVQDLIPDPIAQSTTVSLWKFCTACLSNHQMSLLTLVVEEAEFYAVQHDSESERSLE